MLIEVSLIHSNKKQGKKRMNVYTVKLGYMEPRGIGKH